MDTTAADFLLRDRLTNIDMLEQLKTPGAKVLYAGSDGVLLQNAALFLLSALPGTADRFLPLLLSALPKNGECLAVLHTPELTEPLLSDHGFSTIMNCRNWTYDSAAPAAFSVPPDTEIRPLDQSFAEFVHAHYHSVDDIVYVRERIGAGMLGAFVNGELAGFIGTHDELSIGLLEVLPRFRRRGLAFALEASIVNRLLSEGRLPFCQVRVGNAASEALQEKLGFSVSARAVYWLERVCRH